VTPGHTDDASLCTSDHLTVTLSPSHCDSQSHNLANDLANDLDSSSSDSAIPFQKIMTAWNDQVPHVKMRSLAGKRRDAVRARCADYGVDGVLELIARVAGSAFLTTTMRGGKGCTCDWPFLPNNAQKILEATMTANLGGHWSVTVLTTSTRVSMNYELTTDAAGYEWVAVPPVAQMEYAGVPPRFRNVRWEIDSPAMVTGIPDPLPVKDKATRESLEWLSEWSRADGVLSVVLHARPGRGKTTYAAATIHRLLPVQPRPRWVDWPTLAATVADSWTDRDTGERDVLRPFIRCGFLVLDDFGKESSGNNTGNGFRDWQRRAAFELVNGRYERLLPTLITTELCSGEMAERWIRPLPRG